MGGQAINVEEYVTELAEEKPFLDSKDIMEAAAVETKDISKETTETASVEKKTEEKAE